MLLALETSCDETALALISLDKPIVECAKVEDFLVAELLSSQVKLHEAYGGVVPELAAREHLTNLPVLFDKLLKDQKLDVSQIKVIAVTRGPGLKGSLLVGFCFAKAFAFAKQIPLIPLNHIEGHIFAGLLLEKEKRLEYPCLALVVSGGHTELVYMESFRKYQIVARTMDDAVGEAFDKSATLLGLPYPGGPALAECAKRGILGKFNFPVGVSNSDRSFSFSGVKTAIARVVRSLAKIDEQTKNDLSASIEHCLVQALVAKTEKAIRKYKPKSLLLTGGVAANETLRIALENLVKKFGIRFSVPPKKWCTDNAVMLGALGSEIYHQNKEKFVKWSAADSLGPEVPLDIDVLARFPIEEIR